MVRLNAQRVWMKDLLVVIVVSGLVSLSPKAIHSHDLSIHVPPSKKATTKKLVNPHVITEDFLSKGRDLFQRKAFCAGCHGPDGKGSGMNGNPYDVKGPFPVNFTDAKWQALRSDGEIFYVLKEGVRGTNMAPFLHLVLSEEEAWQVVAYIRTFKKS